MLLPMQPLPLIPVIPILLSTWCKTSIMDGWQCYVLMMLTPFNSPASAYPATLQRILCRETMHKVYKAKDCPNGLPRLKRKSVSHVPHLTATLPESQRDSMEPIILMPSNRIPFAILNSRNPLRPGSELGVRTACFTMHHCMIELKLMAARLPLSVECMNLCMRGGKFRGSLVTRETCSIINERDMHTAFTSHALLSICVLEALHPPPPTCTCKAPSMPLLTVCRPSGLAIHNNDALLVYP